MQTTKLYIIWSELCRRNLSPTLATARNVGLVAQCELSGCVKLGFWGQLIGRKFSHRPGNPATVGVVRWPSAGDTAGYRLCWPKITPVSLISMVQTWCTVTLAVTESTRSTWNVLIQLDVARVPPALPGTTRCVTVPTALYSFWVGAWIPQGK